MGEKFTTPMQIEPSQGYRVPIRRRLCLKKICVYQLVFRSISTPLAGCGRPGWGSGLSKERAWTRSDALPGERRVSWAPVDQTTANQERELRQVGARMGCEITKVYRDHGISGAKGRDKRPITSGRRGRKFSGRHWRTRLLPRDGAADARPVTGGSAKPARRNSARCTPQ